MSRRPDDRRLDFKFQGLTNDEMRRRREETTIELRKSKREDSLSKRRNIVATNDSASSLSLADDFSEPKETARDGACGQEHVAPLMSSDYDAILGACVGLRRILSKERNPPIQDVVNLNVVPRLVELLSGNGIPADCPREVAEKIIFESAWALTNIASGESQHTMVVVQANAVPIFIQSMLSTNKDIREQSVWALGNIAGDSPALRDYVLQCNVMMNLLQVIMEEASNPRPNLPLLRNAVWTVSNLCRNKPPPAWVQIAVCIPVLTQMLSSTDDEILVDACWAFSYITDSADHHIGEVINSGAVATLIRLLEYPNLLFSLFCSHKSSTVQTPALRSMGNVVTGDDDITQVVVDMGLLVPLKNLLSSQRANLKKEACWCISNITAGTLPQIKAVYELGIFPILIQVLSQSDFKTKREACWALCNATSCFESCPEIIRYLIGNGLMQPLVKMLSVDEPKILQVTLDGFENILQVGEEDAVHSEDNINQFALQFEDADGLDLLWELQSHQDMNVYLKAKNIVQKFFSDENEEIKLDISSGQQFAF